MQLKGRSEMKNRIEQLVENLLSEAYPAIEEGGTFPPKAFILHPGGVQPCVICGRSSGRSAWDQINRTINKMMKALNGDVVVLLVNLLIKDEVFDISAPRQLISGRGGELKVTVWSPYGFGAAARQRYVRCADGMVLFGKLHWDRSSA
jgi:hypothetical protein